MDTPNIYGGIDLPYLSALLDASADITKKIAEFRAKHGNGSHVEMNVAHMLEASINALDRAVAVAEPHPPTHAALSAVAVRLREHLESTYEEHRAWLQIEYDLAVMDAEGQTKH